MKKARVIMVTFTIVVVVFFISVTIADCARGAVLP